MRTNSLLALKLGSYEGSSMKIEQTLNDLAKKLSLISSQFNI